MGPALRRNRCPRPNHEIPLIPFIDFLLCLVAFLLVTAVWSQMARGDFKYPELADKITSEWKTNGSHRAASDHRFDQAVLHTDNSAPFQEVIAVIDAIHAPEREFAVAGQAEKVPAFNLTFAVN